MKELNELKKWVNSLGPNWNLFGDVDKAKHNIEKIEQRLQAGQVDAIVNRQNRFVIEPTQQDNGWTYWVWEGDTFDRELVCRFSTLEEAKEWIAYKVGG